MFILTPSKIFLYIIVRIHEFKVKNKVSLILFDRYFSSCIRHIFVILCLEYSIYFEKRLVVNVTNVHHRNKATTFLYETYDLKRWTRQEIHVRCHRVFLQTFDVLCWEYSLGEGTWLSHSELQNPISHTKPPQHVSFMSKQNNLKCSTIHNVLLFVTWVHRFTTRFTYPLSVHHVLLMDIFLTYLSIRLIRIK